MRRTSRLAAAVLAGAAFACAHATAPAPARALPAVPTGAPRPFAALYRLECCSQSNLVAAIRGDGEQLAVSVAAGPAGTVVEAWLGEHGGFLRDRGKRCVRPLPADTLPLAHGAALPLDPWLAALLLSGMVPDGATPSPRGAGWRTTRRSEYTVSWQVSGGLVTRLEVAAGPGDRPSLLVALGEHHGVVPGRLSFSAGREKGVLRLVEWHSTAPPARPTWVAEPVCAEAR
jgi:hypothetical protein